MLGILISGIRGRTVRKTVSLVFVKPLIYTFCSPVAQRRGVLDTEDQQTVYADL
jgi:hypothetical protein